jgi:beta-lactamase class A
VKFLKTGVPVSLRVVSVILFACAILGFGFWAQQHYLDTAVSVVSAPPGSIDPKVATAIEERIQNSGADVGVAFQTLDGRLLWSHHATDAFHAASTMKIPVMIEMFHQIREGKLKPDQSLTIKNEFHSLADQSLFALDPKDDSETDLYLAVGQRRTLSQLCDLMITVSSNLATNLLIQKLGVENIRAMVHSLHADGMNVLRGVEDNKAFEKGLNNTTNAQGLAVLMEAIAKGVAVDADDSRQMIQILEKQKFNEGIPAGVPAGTRVAHKTGELTKLHHDAAVVYAKRPFVLVILVRGMADFKESSALMADITRKLYQASQ